jgi:hypothetical protein
MLREVANLPDSIRHKYKLDAEGHPIKDPATGRPVVERRGTSGDAIASAERTINEINDLKTRLDTGDLSPAERAAILDKIEQKARSAVEKSLRASDETGAPAPTGASDATAREPQPGDTGASSAVPTTDDYPSTYSGTSANRPATNDVSAAVTTAVPRLATHFQDGQVRVVSPTVVEVGAHGVTRQVRIEVVAADQLARPTDVANFDLSTTPAVIRVSATVDQRHVERALAHELAEIHSTLAAASGGPQRSARDALHEDSPAGTLSHHDLGRIAELRVLSADLADPAKPRQDTEAEMRALLIHLGVHNPKGQRLRTDGPAGQRRALIEAELGRNLDSLGLWIKPQPDALTDNEGLPLRGDHDAPDSVPRRDATYEDVDTVIPAQLVAALEKFGLSRETVVTYVMNHHNNRSRQRYLPDLEGLVRQHAPEGMTATDVWSLDLYTTRLFFAQLNKRLRLRQDTDTTAEIQGVLNAALAKLPVHGGGDIYRSLAIDDDAIAGFLAAHPIGREVIWHSFTSVAGEVEGTFYDKPEHNVLFVVRNSDSHDISQFADGINYRDPPKGGPELLMPGGIKVVVTEVTSETKADGSQGHRIVVEQVRVPADPP